MAAGTIIAIASLFGAASKAAGQIKAGNAAARAGEADAAAAESEAQVSEFNATVAEHQAADAEARGLEQENRFRMGVRGMVGAQRAGAAAGNIDVTSGSAVEVQADAAFLGELDALTIRNNAAREAWGYKIEAVDLRRRADIQRKEGANAAAAGREAQTASRFGAVDTVATTTASLLEARYGFGKTKRAG